MEAIVLAGGVGKRLRPLTKDLPKAMVPVNGKPLLQYQLDILKGHKIEKIVLACGYKWEKIKQYYGTKFVYSVEEEPLGTAGAVRNALEHIAGQEFIVLNSDDITDIDIGKFVKMGSNTTAVAHFHSNFGIVDVEGDKIVQFREKPMMPYWANVGLHLLNKDVKFPAKGSLEQDVLPLLAKQGKLNAYKHTGFWHTVNTAKDLEEVEAFLKKSKNIT